jgi:hypothetical protein
MPEGWATHARLAPRHTVISNGAGRLFLPHSLPANGSACAERNLSSIEHPAQTANPLFVLSYSFPGLCIVTYRRPIAIPPFPAHPKDQPDRIPLEIKLTGKSFAEEDEMFSDGFGIPTLRHTLILREKLEPLAVHIRIILKYACGHCFIQFRLLEGDYD